MSRTIPVLVAFAFLSPGCVPVTNPVGDIDKAEPDEALVGTWVSTKNPSDIVRFEVREVKGVPKGMMPMTALGTSPERDPYWLFVSAVGKEKFGNLCMDTGGGKNDVWPDFREDGAYRRWARSNGRLYVVFRYATDKDEITLNFGDEKAFEAVAREAKLPMKKETVPFETPIGWLAKYIEKNGFDTIFPAEKEIKFKRKK
jgi:hypothetical protein